MNAGRGRRVTISLAVPGAQYRITAWHLVVAIGVQHQQWSMLLLEKCGRMYIILVGISGHHKVYCSIILK